MKQEPPVYRQTPSNASSPISASRRASVGVEVNIEDAIEQYQETINQNERKNQSDGRVASGKFKSLNFSFKKRKNTRSEDKDSNRASLTHESGILSRKSSESNVLDAKEETKSRHSNSDERRSTISILVKSEGDCNHVSSSTHNSNSENDACGEMLNQSSQKCTG